VLLLSLNISFLQSLSVDISACIHTYCFILILYVCYVQKFDKELYITDGEVLCDMCVCVCACARVYI
jgi:hypothetical protein